MTRDQICSLMLTIAVLSVSVAISAQRSGGTGTTTTSSGRAGTPIAGTPPSTGASRGGRATQPSKTDTSPAGIAVKSATERVTKLNKAILNLDKASMREMPKNLTATEREQWTEEGKWIRNVKSRYAAYTQELDTATKSRRDAMDVLASLSELDEKYIELQVSTQEESQKFSGLSKPLQSRHDAALKAIKDIK